jgi:hypothetical protein
MDDRYGTWNVVEAREAEQQNAGHQLGAGHGPHYVPGVPDAEKFGTQPVFLA